MSDAKRKLVMCCDDCPFAEKSEAGTDVTPMTVIGGCALDEAPIVHYSRRTPAEREEQRSYRSAPSWCPLRAAPVLVELGPNPLAK
jgi:hypothetical protein